MKRSLAFAFPLLATGALLFLTPTMILPVCEVQEGAAPMRCFWSGRVLAGYGATLFALGVFLYFCRTAAARAGVAASALMVAISAVLTPTFVIGMCRSPSMPCNTGTYPGALVVLALTAAACIAILFYLRRRITWEKRNDEASHHNANRPE